MVHGDTRYKSSYMYIPQTPVVRRILFVKRILFTLYLVPFIKRISKSEPFVMNRSKQHFQKKNEAFRSCQQLLRTPFLLLARTK